MKFVKDQDGPSLAAIVALIEHSQIVDAEPDKAAAGFPAGFEEKILPSSSGSLASRERGWCARSDVVHGARRMKRGLWPLSALSPRTRKLRDRRNLPPACLRVGRSA